MLGEPIGAADPSRLRTLEDLRRRLLDQAALFDDPVAYGAGVLDALDLVSTALERELVGARGTEEEP